MVPMKVFISADIEGCCGVTDWNEATISHAEYPPFREQMTAEVVAACEGALAAGAREILVRDAHGSARNLVGADLPREARLMRAWSGDPMCMVEGLDASFDAALFVGYHARAGSGGNPLAHTMSSRSIAGMRLNGRWASEYLVYAQAAATVDVPVVFLSGDKRICEEVDEFNPGCRTFAVKSAKGAATHNLHPAEALEGIREGSETGLREAREAARLTLADSHVLEVDFKDTSAAYKKSFYPGAELAGDRTVRLEARDYMDVLRAILFLI